MFAVVKTGGKQYRVTPGDVIVVEKLLGDTGAKITLDQVLMVCDDGKSLEVGSPLLSNAGVNCEILDQFRGNKVIVFKKKRRKGYKRTKGHRQEQTVLRVIDINGKGAVKPATKEKLTKKEKTKLGTPTELSTKTQAPAPALKSASSKKKVAAKKKAGAKKKSVTKKKSTTKI